MKVNKIAHEDQTIKWYSHEEHANEIKEKIIKTLNPPFTVRKADRLTELAVDYHMVILEWFSNK